MRNPFRRRSRIDGDGWDGEDIPLGEVRERYRVHILRDGVVLHEADVGAPEHTVPEQAWAQASAGGPFVVAVAQLSDQFGPGPYVRRIFNDH